MSLPNHFTKYHNFRTCIFILSFSSAHFPSQVGAPQWISKEEEHLLHLGFTPFLSLDSGTAPGRGCIQQMTTQCCCCNKECCHLWLLRFFLMLKIRVLYVVICLSNSCNVCKALCHLDPPPQILLAPQGHKQLALVSFKCFNGIISLFLFHISTLTPDLHTMPTSSNLLTEKNGTF